MAMASGENPGLATSSSPRVEEGREGGVHGDRDL